MSKKKKKEAQAVLTDGTVLPYIVTDNPPRGGMKHTYFAPDKSYVIQFFNKPEDAQDQNLHKRLEKIIGAYNPTRSEAAGGAAGNTEATANYFDDLYCWPYALVAQPEFGIVCPTYPKAFFFDADASQVDALDLKGKDKKSRWFTSPRVSKYLRDEEKGDFRSMLSIAILLSRAVRRMHQAGLSHSDLSENNVLIDPKGGRCVVIDIDSLVVPGLFPPEVAGTKGYIAPEVLETMELPMDDPGRALPCIRTDLFAMAVLIYQYLLHRHPLEGPKVYSTASPEEDDFLMYGPQATFIEDPKEPSNRPKDLAVTIHDLGPELEQLFLRAFCDGLHNPSERPSAMEWEKALVHAWDILEPCANPACPAHWFPLPYGSEPVCPFCGTRIDRRDVLHLRIRQRMNGRRGQWITRQVINVYDGMPFFAWHFHAGVFPDEKVQDRSMMAYVSHQGGAWYLVNRSLAGMRSPGGRLVPPGQAVRLEPGRAFLTTEDADGVVFEAMD